MRRCVFLVMLLVAVGCGTKDPITPTAVQQIMPLRVGNEWQWEHSGFEQSVGGYVDVSGTAIEAITDQIIIGNETWYRSFLEIIDTVTVVVYGGGITVRYDTTSIVWYYANRSDGLWSRGDVSESPFLDVKFPVRAGELYMLDAFTQVRVISVNELISAPAGDFSCIHYLTTIEATDSIHTYYRPNVGLVEYFYTWETPGAFIRFSLTGLDLK